MSFSLVEAWADEAYSAVSACEADTQGDAGGSVATVGRARVAGEPAAPNGAEVLGKCFLFQATDDAGRKRLAERAHKRSYGAGEKIFAFGSAGQSMMAIVSGTVRIARPTPKGKEIIL